MNENITTTQKYEKYYRNAKKYYKPENVKNIKYMGRGGRLGKPQLHWLHPLKTV